MCRHLQLNPVQYEIILRVAIVYPLVEGNAYCSLLFDVSVYVSWVPIVVSQSPAATTTLREEANSIHPKVDGKGVTLMK